MFFRNKETGTALLELAIITPSLIFFSIVACDAGQVIRNHYVLAQAVRESVRQAGSVEYLEPGQNELAANGPDTWVCNSGGTCPVQSEELLHLARKVLELQSKTLDIDLSKSTITSLHDPAAKTISITIRTTYRGIFLPFAGMSIASSSTGPYI